MSVKPSIQMVVCKDCTGMSMRGGGVNTRFSSLQCETWMWNIKILMGRLGLKKHYSRKMGVTTRGGGRARSLYATPPQPPPPPSPPPPPPGF